MTLHLPFTTIDADTGEALKEHFKGLDKETTLRVFGKEHPKYAELKNLLQDVSQCSDKILLKEPARRNSLRRRSWWARIHLAYSGNFAFSRKGKAARQLFADSGKTVTRPH